MRNILWKAGWFSAVSFMAGLALSGVCFAQQARVKPVQQVIIEDSKGKTIGRILGGVGLHNMEVIGSSDLNIRTIVLLQVDQNLVAVAVGRDRFYGGRVLWFESENCLGTPWMPPNDPPLSSESPSLLTRVAIGPPGQSVYMPIPNAATQAITIKSLLEFGNTCRNQTFNNIQAFPAQPLVDLLTVFTPPFSLRAAP